jgi:prepilin-type N-terminal cleavage/methylation domain-containing protein
MRRAFTLMELLVTLAIIGILAALLLSALGGAKEIARRTTCINNLHQVNLALALYADDHADFLRSAAKDYHIYFTYKDSIQSYLTRNGSSTNNRIFVCPTDDFDCAAPAIGDFFSPEIVTGRGFHHLKQTDYSSYIFNGEAASSTDARATQKAFSSVRQPSKLALVGELSAAIGLSAHDHKQSKQVNDAKNVMAFVDEHVSYIPIYWNGKTGAANMPVAYNPPTGYDYVWLDK